MDKLVIPELAHLVQQANKKKKKNHSPGGRGEPGARGAGGEAVGAHDHIPRPRYPRNGRRRHRRQGGPRGTRRPPTTTPPPPPPGAPEPAPPPPAPSGLRMPTFASTGIAANRSPRASGRCRTCRDPRVTVLGLRVLVNGAWGFAATNAWSRRGARRRGPGRGHRARQRHAGLAEGGARRRRQSRDHLEQPDQARSVRGAARHQDRVPDEAQRSGDGREGRQLRQLADSVRRRAEILSPPAKVRESRSGWCAPIRNSASPPPIAPAAISRPAPWSIAPSCSATNTSRTTRGLRDAEKAGHEVVEKLTAKPVSPGRYDIVVDPSQLFLAIHESVGHSTELDRALG